jgi:hypothetical protein
VFAVRWTGKIKAEFTGTHTFWTEVDDGYRLVVGGTVLHDRLDARQPMTISAPATIDLVAGQEYDVTFTMVEADGDAGARLYWANAQVPREVIPRAVLTPVVPDPTPPALTDVLVDGHIATPALYTPAAHLILKFSEPVTGVDDFDFSVIDPFGSLLGAEAWDVVYDPATNTAVFTWAATPLDGNYTLLSSDNISISDSDGNALDGDRNGQAGGALSIPFYIFRGDTQMAHDGTPLRDRSIGFPDYQIMAKNFGMTNPSHADGDFNYDGVIDNNDFTFVRDNFGNTLPPPAPPAPPVSTTPTPVPTKPGKTPAPKPVAARPAAAATAAPAPAKPAPVAKPAPAKFATRKIGAKDVLA